MSPRGNDGTAAGTELQARTGEAPNAEDMIAANTARWPAELRAANNRPVDQAATDDLDEDAVAGELDVEGEVEVLAWAVRGPFLVIVYEDESGEIHKKAVTRKGQEKQAQRLAPPPEDAEKADKEAQEQAEKEHKDAELDEKDFVPGEEATTQRPAPTGARSGRAR